MTRKRSRLGMPSKEKIFEYWYQDEQTEKLGINSEGILGIEELACFACGDVTSGLERCHIIPLVFGGSNDVSNLHLLCRHCHVDSEGIKVYWDWFHYKRRNHWDWPMNYIKRKLKSYGFDIDNPLSIASDYNYDAHRYVNDVLKSIYWGYSENTNGRGK